MSSEECSAIKLGKALLCSADKGDEFFSSQGGRVDREGRGRDASRWMRFLCPLNWMTGWDARRIRHG
ncbi:MAG: hypothetical protein EAZ81_06860 [Verrucomicrobia bacterium]|nr:MAG: hypothetical protein EAZ81_06860 [Verrucomicrobiota bacterium]